MEWDGSLYQVLLPTKYGGGGHGGGTLSDLGGRGPYISNCYKLGNMPYFKKPGFCQSCSLNLTRVLFFEETCFFGIIHFILQCVD